MDKCLNDSYCTQEISEHAGKGMYIEGTDIFAPCTIIYKFVESSEIKSAIQMASPWWFGESTLRKVLLNARDLRHLVDSFDAKAAAKTARENAALSKNWKNSEGYLMAGANYLLVGKLLSLTRCWYGKPKVVGVQHAVSEAEKKLIEEGKYYSKVNPVFGIDGYMDTVGYIELIPDPRCTQLYFPGMREIANRLVIAKKRVRLRNNIDLNNGEIETFIMNMRT